MAFAAEKLPSDDALLDAYSASVSEAVDRIGPAVCRIERIGAGGHGSGFVIAQDGLVVTNFHVVGDARAVRVTMPDGASREGHVLGRDPDTDIALVRAPTAASPMSRRSAIPNACAAARSRSPSAIRSVSNGPSLPASSRRSVARCVPRPAG